MDSFEIKTDNFDPSRLRSSQSSGQPSESNHIPLTDIEQAALAADERPHLRPDFDEPEQTEQPTAEPATTATTASATSAPRTRRPSTAASSAGSAPKTSAQTSQRRPEAEQVNLNEHRTIVGLTEFLTDGRMRIFFGVLLIIMAGYMLIASISYISSASADQSIVINSSQAQIAQSHDGIENEAGWFGAMISHLLFYRWLGIGGFVIIFYIAALGISLVKLHHFRFWQLTLKSIVAAIALSIIAGLINYDFATDTLWGGEHGYWVNNIVISAASYWGAIGLSLLMLTILVLIFLKPITKFIRTIKSMIARRKEQMAARYRSSMAAARAAMQHEREKSENKQEATAAAEPTNAANSIDDQVLTPDPMPKDEPAESKPTTPQPVYVDVTPYPQGSPRPATATNPAPTLSDIEPAASAPHSNTTEPRQAAYTQPNSTVVIYKPIDEQTDTASQESSPKEDERPHESDLEEIAIADPLQPLAEIPTVVDDEDFNTPDDTQPDDAGVATQTAESENNPDASDSTPTTSGITTEVVAAAPIESAHDSHTSTDSNEPTNSDTDDFNPDDFDYFDPTAELSHYQFPSIELLHHRESSYTLTEEEQEENNHRIISTLDAYGIKIDTIKATVGPTITLYEVVPQRGTRIASIKRLGDDMALSLSAIGIRIIAPIPGKGTIGMEVPNKHPQIVGIRSILSSTAYHESTAMLPVALGTTIDNQVYVTDLAKMPHLLVAGATGMGKSVGLNTIVASLLYKKHPAELKFVLVDPKVVEFSLYKTLERHFLAKLPEEQEAIITEPTKVVATLNSLCLEMDNRYELLAKANVREIKAYNQKFISRQLNPNKGHRFMPYIVVIIDEFADLIMTAGKDLETPIARIAQKARAVGIHLILATQRPSVNVITGMIKANFPARMAFRVTQMNDSRTILDRPGAEQLIGRGDMLISRDGVLDRVQCAFIDTDEVEAINNFISAQMGYDTAYELPEELPAATEGGGGAGSIADRDPLYTDAGHACIDANMGSASMIQRKFQIGYPRAGKIIDQLEQGGLLGPQTGMGKPRAVLMDHYAFERSLEN